MSPMMESGMGANIGFSVGGAKDIENFRENIKKGFLPIPTDITYEGLFYDYYFDTGQSLPCAKLFCPSYSSAISKDPFSGNEDYYLSVGLNSGIQDFHRKKLNLVVVLDISGSMSSPFDEYYYDRFGKRIESRHAESGKNKMQVATESLAAMLTHLKSDDRLGIVLFDDEGYLAKPLGLVKDTKMNTLRSHILELQPAGGTNMEAGMALGTILFESLLSRDQRLDTYAHGIHADEYENRIIFLTDAMPNMGQTSQEGLFGMMEKNSKNKLYSTFIGIGVDLNTELVEALTKIQGANSYSVHSSTEFKKRLDEEFEYMVTPLVFNLELKLEGSGFEIEKVYGSPEADQATGHILKVNTLFPSKTEEGRTRGGLILLKLKKTLENPRLEHPHLNLIVTYEDRLGKSDQGVEEVKLPSLTSDGADYFDNTGIRKGVLLARYADLLKNWLADENDAVKKNQTLHPSPPTLYRVTREHGILPPLPEDFKLGRWERQSNRLQVSEHYKELLKRWKQYFGTEQREIGDSTLDQEAVVIDQIIKA